MLDVLKLVRGAVSKKDMLPVLTHFYIYNGRIQGSNGRLCIDSECTGLNIPNLVVPADKFLRAVDACDGDPTLIIKDEKLTVKKGKFRVSIATLPESSYPVVSEFDGKAAEINGPIIPMLKKLAPFISTDASRPWSNTVLIWEGHAYATNNVILLRGEIPVSSILVLPVYLVDEMVRIGEEPLSIKSNGHGVTVEYATFKLKGQRIMDEWPSALVSLRQKMLRDDLPEALPNLYENVVKLKPFFPDEKLPVVVFSEEGIGTRDGVQSALLEIEGLPAGLYRFESLVATLEIATHIDFTMYPQSIPFRGAGIEGLLTCMRS
jgi:hypothetical protein